MTRTMKNRNSLNVLAVLAVVVFGSQSAQAVTDEVVRKSTTSAAKGEVTEISKTGVTVKPQIGSTVTVPAADIQRIRWDGEPPKLNLARADETGGRFEKALEGYAESAKDPKANKDNIKMDIAFLIARTTAKMALTDTSKRDEAVTKLEAFRKTWADSFYFYEAAYFLGQVYMAQQDFAKASEAFEELARADSEEYKTVAKNASGRLLLQEGKIPEALAAFDAVIGQKAEGAVAQSCRFDALLGKAACQIRQQKHEEAVQTLDAVVTQNAAAEERILAEAYVRQGDSLQALGRVKEAVLAYLHVPVLFPKEAAFHAESLYHLSQLWKLVGKPDRAADAQAKLESAYPNSEWAKKLAVGAGQ